MQKKKLRFKSLGLGVAAATSLAIGAVACGPRSPVAPLPNYQQYPNGYPGGYNGPVCGGGTVSLGGSACFNAADFNRVCQTSVGQLIQVNGAAVCKFDLNFNFYTGYGNLPPSLYNSSSGSMSLRSSNGFPTLMPDGPASGLAFRTTMYARKGDKLSFTGTGGWSAKSVKSYKFLIFSGYQLKTDCNDVSLAGTVKTNAGTETVYNGQVPQGMMASDGVQTYFLGSSASNIPIQNDGQLLLGLNAPDSQGGCLSGSITRLRLTRCQDAAGNTYVCP